MFTTTVTPSFFFFVLARWFEMARNPIFRIFEPDLNLSHSVWTLIMARTEYDFVGELFFQYDVEIRTFIERIGTKSFTVYQEAWQENRLCAKGKAVVVHFNFEQKETTPIPEDKKAKLTAHLISESSQK